MLNKLLKKPPRGTPSVTTLRNKQKKETQLKESNQTSKLVPAIKTLRGVRK